MIKPLSAERLEQKTLLVCFIGPMFGYPQSHPQPSLPHLPSLCCSRFIGASGFQLINVNNVPLSLGSWSLDTKLLGRKAMINSLARHYFAQGISEAHKVTPFFCSLQSNHLPPPFQDRSYSIIDRTRS